MPLMKYRIYELSARAVISYGRERDGAYTFRLSAAETEKALLLVGRITRQRPSFS